MQLRHAVWAVRYANLHRQAQAVGIADSIFGACSEMHARKARGLADTIEAPAIVDAEAIAELRASDPRDTQELPVLTMAELVEDGGLEP